MRYFKVLVVSLLLLIGSVAVFGEQKVVRVMHGWPAQQGEAFDKVVAAFKAAHPDIDVVVEVVGRDRPAILATRLAAGNPPDVSPIPWLGLMAEWARAGYLVPLDGLVDVSEQVEALTPLGYVDGELYGVWQSANIKSLVWYNVNELGPNFNLPTWEALLAFTKGLAVAGKPAWSIGLESGAASGWPGTDWIEDIMLRTAGPELYDKWVAHEIPWTHPAVRRAFELFGEIVLNPDYVLGGPVGALTTNFGDAPAALFTDPPQAYLHRQATFIQGFILNTYPDLVPGEDFDVFPFPPIDPEAADGIPILGAGDVSVVFKTGGPLRGTRPEVIEFVQFLASKEAQEIWIRELGELAANKTVDADAIYTNPITRKAWDILLNAKVFRFDGSDLMPGAVGAGSFWQGVLDYVSGVPLDTVLEAIEQSAIEAYGK